MMDCYIRAGWTACLLGALLVPGVASAADVPGNTTSKARLMTGQNGYGLMEVPNDSDWYRIDLKGGKDYGVAASRTTPTVGPFSLVTRVRDLAGNVLKASDTVTGQWNGLEYRPPRTGTYFIEVLDLGYYRDYPGRYRVMVTTDCRGDTKTTCSIRPGQTLQGTLNWGTETDNFRTVLKRGVAYTATLALGPKPQPSVDLFLQDARGRYIDQGDSPFSFKVPSDGTYFVQVSGAAGPDPVRYRLSLRGR